jgi:hypothetical protein
MRAINRGRSRGFIHCPHCDLPVDFDIYNIVAVDSLARGQVPGHPECHPKPYPINAKRYWSIESAKHSRFLAALRVELEMERYEDWVEGTLENTIVRSDGAAAGGQLTHCPCCDLPFAWDDPNSRTQYECGIVPGHLMCPTVCSKATEFDLHKELHQLDRMQVVSKAS